MGGDLSRTQHAVFNPREIPLAVTMALGWKAAQGEDDRQGLPGAEDLVSILKLRHFRDTERSSNLALFRA